MSTKGHTEAIEGLRRLVLTGFMGSGKTTVGHLLAEQIGWRFADLDKSIEELLGGSVPQIFADHGEEKFRAGELDALRELLPGSRIVIALGGGAPEQPGVRELLAGAPETAVVYLNASFETLYGRCVRELQEPGSTDRPLLGTREEAEARLKRRVPFYEAVATHTIMADDDTPAAVVERLLEVLGSQLRPL